MISDRRKWIVLCVLIVSLLAVVLDKRLSSAATAISLNIFAMAGVYFFMSFYLQNVGRFSPAARRIAHNSGGDRPIGRGEPERPDTRHPAGHSRAGRGVSG